MKIKVSKLNPLERLAYFAEIIKEESKQPPFWKNLKNILTSPPPQARGER